MEEDRTFIRQGLPEERTVPVVQISVRGLPLLQSERIVEQFSPDEGLVISTPDKGDLLVLTNQRVMSFVEAGEHKETFLAPLDELKGLSVKSNNRGPKDMLQGPILILLGVVVYFMVGYSLERVAIAAVLGAAVVLVGVLLSARYMLWEEEGSILFQGGSLEMGFPFRTNRASTDVYKVVTRFFDLKLSANSNHTGPISRQGGVGYSDNSPDDSHYDF